MRALIERYGNLGRSLFVHDVCDRLAGGQRAATSWSVAAFDGGHGVVLSWSMLRADLAKARIAPETSRRAFATERRPTHTAIVDLLERAQRWN